MLCESHMTVQTGVECVCACASIQVFPHIYLLRVLLFQDFIGIKLKSFISKHGADGGTWQWSPLLEGDAASSEEWDGWVQEWDLVLMLALCKVIFICRLGQMQKHNNPRTKAPFRVNTLLSLHAISQSDREKGCWFHAIWQARDLHAWQALNQTITLWHSALHVMLTSPIAAFPITSLILFLCPCLLSVISLSFFSFTSPFMCAGSASQFLSSPPHHHHPSARFSSISMWRLFISEVPSWPDCPHPTHSLCHSLNGCSIEEKGSESESKPSFLPLLAPPLWLSQKWYVPQQELQKLREHIVCNLALQGSLPDSCVRSLSPAHIPSFPPPPCVSK